MADLNRPNHLRLVDGRMPLPLRELPRKKVELTPEQRARLASVLRNLRRLYGTDRKVAAALGLSVAATQMVLHRNRGGSVDMIARAARLAGISVESILYGAIIDVDRCPACKQKVPKSES